MRLCIYLKYETRARVRAAVIVMGGVALSSPIPYESRPPKTTHKKRWYGDEGHENKKTRMYGFRLWIRRRRACVARHSCCL